MKISLCIASRGKPRELLRTVAETDANIARPEDVTISVALDTDDDLVPTQPPKTRAQIVWDIGPREDSLGEKYNRAARNAAADLYVLGADDNVFIRPGWDETLRETMAEFGDGFGLVYFGRMDGALPTQMAIPRALVEAQGFVFPSYWPFWFHDTWVDEIGHMTGRILWADIAIEEIDGRGKTRGLREVVFWAKLFEALRPQREQIASALSEKFNPRWLHMQLEQRRNILEMYFRARQSQLLNPATAIQYERRMSFDAAKTERYDRIKAQAVELVKSLAAKSEAA